MRYSEIIPESKKILTEEMLREAFLQGLQQKLGAAIQQPIKAVVDAKTALGVLYKVVSDPKYLDTVTFELKRALKRQSAQIKNQKLQQAIYSRWPQGRTLADFFKALLLYALSKSASVATNLTTDQAVDYVTKQVVDIEALVGNIISTAGGSILSVMKSLGVADKLFFEILTYINSKIITNPAIQNKGPIPVQQTLSKVVSESKAVDELKKDLLAAKKKGVKLDYDGVGKIMEKIWNRHGMTGQKLHDVFVKEVGLVPDTWIKKQKQVSEIQRTPASASDDWESNEKAKEIPGLKMVPGSSQYGYVFATLKGKERLNLTGTDLTINFYDTKARGGMLHIGYIYFRNITFPPYKKAIQVSNVVLDSRYRGKGIGIMMYTTVLQLGYVIVADETQTPQARKLWVTLNQTTGVQVMGRIEMFASDLDVETDDEWDKRKARANIKKLKNLGATIPSNLDEYGFNDYVPIDFLVQPGKNGAELAAKGIKMYSNKHPEDMEEDYFVNLYARWVG